MENRRSKGFWALVIVASWIPGNKSLEINNVWGALRLEVPPRPIEKGGDGKGK